MDVYMTFTFLAISGHTSEKSNINSRMSSDYTRYITFLSKHLVQITNKLERETRNINSWFYKWHYGTTCKFVNSGFEPRKFQAFYFCSRLLCTIFIKYMLHETIIIFIKVNDRFCLQQIRRQHTFIISKLQGAETIPVDQSCHYPIQA